VNGHAERSIKIPYHHKQKSNNAAAAALAQVKPMRRLTANELQTFGDSVRKQLEMFTHCELLNLIQIGHVAVDISSAYKNRFSESDVHILFAPFGMELQVLLSEWNLTWILCFNYFHCDVFPTDGREEYPLENPHWDDIVSMSRGELVSRIEEFMNPMFFDVFEICFNEFQIELRKMPSRKNSKQK
jgi:hypothetical protein